MAIIFVTEKHIEKHIKKWAKYRDFVIIDATNVNNSKLRKYQNLKYFSGLTPSADTWSKGVNVNSSIKNMKKKFDKFIKRRSFKNDVKVISQLFREENGDINIFIVYHKKIYKSFKKELIKKFKKISGLDEKYIVSYAEVKKNKKYLKDTPSFKSLKSIAMGKKKKSKPVRDDKGRTIQDSNFLGISADII